MSFVGRVREPLGEGLLHDDLRAGDIWKVLQPDGSEVIVVDYPSNLTQRMWRCVVPMAVGQGDDYFPWALGNLVKHTVREEVDGTVSVRPGDGSSNSILITRRWAGVETSWHGYVDHNVWTEC
jgi:hypothetical protein